LIYAIADRHAEALAVLILASMINSRSSWDTTLSLELPWIVLGELIVRKVSFMFFLLIGAASQNGDDHGFRL
jgi:hypothetical protein